MIQLPGHSGAGQADVLPPWHPDYVRPFRPTFIAKQLARIAARDEPDGIWRCRYCRREVIRTDVNLRCASDALYPERDHVVPRCRGGTNEFSNLALSCQPCNTSKGDLLLSELPEGWPNVAASHPNRSGGWRGASP